MAAPFAVIRTRGGGTWPGCLLDTSDWEGLQIALLSLCSFRISQRSYREWRRTRKWEKVTLEAYML